MKLINENVIVRDLEEKDMLYIQKLWGDEETMLAGGGAFTIKDEDLDAMYKILRKEENSVNNHFIIETKENYIGDLSIRHFNNESKIAQIDMKIEYAERNKGFFKKALSAYLDYFFNTVKGEGVFIEFWLSNYFVLDKLKEYGFEAETVTDDISNMKLSRQGYFKSILCGGKDEI